MQSVSLCDYSDIVSQCSIRVIGEGTVKTGSLSARICIFIETTGGNVLSFIIFISDLVSVKTAM